MDLDDAAAALYAAAPDAFVARRTELVAQARAAKDRPLATAIGQLRRPTRSAWVVNLLARRAPEEIRTWLELGEALADAQRRGSGTDLRRLSGQRGSTLTTLSRLAARIAADEGHAVTEATRQEVSQTLQAALAEPGVAELVRAGRVTQPVSYGGFGPTDLSTALAASLATAPRRGADAGDASGSAAPDGAETPPPEPAGPTPAQLAARAAADARVAAARQELDRLREAATAAATEAEEATRSADALGDAVADLRSRLAEAEEAERTASEAARSARRRHQQQTAALPAAEDAVRAAEQTVTDLR